MILSNSSGITAAGDLATRILAFVRDSSVLDRLLLGQSIELIRLGTQMNSPVVNSAPQRRRSPVEGGSIHVVVGKT